MHSLCDAVHFNCLFQPVWWQLARLGTPRNGFQVAPDPQPVELAAGALLRALPIRQVAHAHLISQFKERGRHAFRIRMAVYVNDYYEIEGTTVRKYYSAGGQCIAVRENGALSYLLTDDLGSITVSLDGQNLTGTRSYSSWGETRGSAGTLPTGNGKLTSLSK